MPNLVPLYPAQALPPPTLTPTALPVGNPIYLQKGLPYVLVCTIGDSTNVAGDLGILTFQPFAQVTIKPRGLSAPYPLRIAVGQSVTVHGDLIEWVAEAGNGTVVYYAGLTSSSLSAPFVFNPDGSLKIGGTDSTFPQYAGLLELIVFDPSLSKPIPIIYDGVGNTPATGMWRGYAVAVATGAVSIASTDGKTVLLGTATAVGQAFAFILFVSQNVGVTLTNCTIAGGGISL